MMNFWMFVGALLMANVIWMAIVMVLINMKVVQKWYFNYCKKLSEEMVELMDEE